ncbi:MAG: hypothetical protein WCO28_09230 [Bacteroidota bacterium]
MKNIDEIKVHQNLEREKLKSYQREERRVQVEKLTTLKEKKKPKKS